MSGILGILIAFAATSGGMVANAVVVKAVTSSEVVRIDGRVVWIELDHCKSFGLPLISNESPRTAKTPFQSHQARVPVNADDKITLDFTAIQRRLGNEINSTDGWTVQPEPCRVRLWVELPGAQ